MASMGLGIYGSFALRVRRAASDQALTVLEDSPSFEFGAPEHVGRRFCVRWFGGSVCAVAKVLEQALGRLMI